MIRPLKNSGYTLLEALIFIVISSFIFISAFAMFNGRQGQVQYRQSVRELDSKIQTVINDVSTGFFPNTEFSCSLGDFGDTQLNIEPISSNQQGTREECVFVGKAVSYDNTQQDQLAIHAIAAANPPLGSARSILDNHEDVQLTAIDILKNSYTTAWGLEITRIVISSDPSDDLSSEPINYFAYLSDIGNNSNTSSSLESGQQAVNLYTSDSNFADFPNGLRQVSPDEAIYLCLDIEVVNQKAVIVLGADGRQLSTSINQDAEQEYGVVCEWD